VTDQAIFPTTMRRRCRARKAAGGGRGGTSAPPLTSYGKSYPTSDLVRRLEVVEIDLLHNAVRAHAEEPRLAHVLPGLLVLRLS
jgi:hypothetical protein